MKAIPWIITGALIALSLFMHFGGCGTYSEPSASDTIYKRDTLWKRYDTVITKKMTVKEVIHDTLPIQYLPHPNHDSLKSQYEAMVREYASRNVYQDSLKIDSFGYVLIQDTVQFNKLGIRSYSSHYQLPTIIDTVIIRQTAGPKREIYYGGGVSGSFSGLDFAHTGILFKNKKSHITGLYLGVTPDGKLSYGVQKYWKITLKK